MIAFFSLLKFKFDVICISETWLCDNTKDLYCISNYNAYHCTRPSRGGGVSVYVSNKFSSRKLDVCVELQDVDSLFINVSHMSKSVILGCIYKPPRVNPSIFIDQVQNVLSYIVSGRVCDVMLCGDYNI